MTDKQENKRSMYLSVKETVDDFTGSWSVLPAFVNAYGEFNDKLSNLDELRQIQESATGGVTQDKAQAKDEAVTLGIMVSSAVYAFATVSENLTLQALVNYSKSDLDRSRDTILIDMLRVIYNAANANVGSLGDYGILVTNISDFDTAITTYTTQVESPRVAISSGSAATDELVVVIAELDDVLKKKMDKLMEVIRATDGEFYAKYKKARIIVDYRGGGARDSDTTEPAPTEGDG